MLLYISAENPLSLEDNRGILPGFDPAPNLAEQFILHAPVIRAQYVIHACGMRTQLLSRQ